MLDNRQKFRPIFLIIVIPILFSCTFTQQKQTESKDTEFDKDQRVTSDTKRQTELKSKDETSLEDYKIIQMGPQHTNHQKVKMNPQLSHLL